MHKQFLEAIEMLTIAAQHAYCAEHLLKQNAEVMTENQVTVDALLPITSLMHQAFELTLKAFLLHNNRQIGQYKNLFELIELNQELGLSNQDIQLLNTLSRQLAFRKGVDHLLWKNRQEQHLFCEQIMSLYGRFQDLIPLELQKDYQS